MNWHFGRWICHTFCFLIVECVIRTHVKGADPGSFPFTETCCDYFLVPEAVTQRTCVFGLQMDIFHPRLRSMEHWQLLPLGSKGLKWSPWFFLKRSGGRQDMSESSTDSEPWHNPVGSNAAGVFISSAKLDATVSSKSCKTGSQQFRRLS